MWILHMLPIESASSCHLVAIAGTIISWYFSSLSSQFSSFKYEIYGYILFCFNADLDLEQSHNFGGQYKIFVRLPIGQCKFYFMTDVKLQIQCILDFFWSQSDRSYDMLMKWMMILFQFPSFLPTGPGVLLPHTVGSFQSSQLAWLDFPGRWL